MNHDNDNYLNKLSTIYERINKSRTTIIILAIIFAVGVGLLKEGFLEKEASTSEAVEDPESMASTLGTTIFVVWTFSVSLIVFYLGRAEDRKYGIRVIDLMLEDFSISKILGLIFFFVGQLCMLYIAIFFNAICALNFFAVVQLLIMLYVFLMICMESSNTYVRKRIKKHIARSLTEYKTREHGLDWKLSKMLMSTNYTDRRETNLLLQLYLDIIGSIEDEKSPNIEQFTSDFLTQIIQVCDSKETITDITCNLFQKTTNKFAKRGLTKAIIQSSYYLEISSILGIEFVDRRETLLWGIAYCIYVCSYIDMEHCKMALQTIGNLFQKTYRTPNDNDFTLILVFFSEFIHMGVQENRSSGLHSEKDLQMDVLKKGLLAIGWTL